MKKNVSAVVIGAVCALFFCESHSFGQDLSGTSLNVSGTATIGTLCSGTATINLLTSSGTANFTGTAIFNDLEATGAPYFQNNTLYFGTSGTTSALSLNYTDGTNGIGSSVTLQSSLPTTVWNWQRVISGTAAPAMQLDASNRLILTGTAATNPPRLVLDPNGSVFVGDSYLLTASDADRRYVSKGDTSAIAIGWGSGSDSLGNTIIGPCITLTGGIATSPYSFAGTGATATGAISTALGLGSTASGYMATAMGPHTTAAGYGQFVIGQYNISQGDPTKWIGSDDLFIIGNGVHDMDYSGVWVDGYWDGYYAQQLNYRVENEVCLYGYYDADGVWVDGYWNSQWQWVDGPWDGIGLFPGDYPQPDCWYWYSFWADGYWDHSGVYTETQSNALVVKKNGDTTIYGNLTVSGTRAGLVVTGTVDENGIVVASGSNQMALIPQQGDLSMGNFHAGAQPVSTDPSQMVQQNVQKIASSQMSQGTINTKQNTGSPRISGTGSTIAAAMADGKARAAAMGVTIPPVVLTTTGSNGAVTSGTMLLH